MTVLITHQLDSRTKKISSKIEEQHIIIKELICQEDLILNSRTLIYMKKEKLIELIGEIGESIIIIWDVNTTMSEPVKLQYRQLVRM